MIYLKSRLILENIQEVYVKSIRPGFGLETKYIKDIIGKKAKVDIKRGTPMKWSLLE